MPISAGTNTQILDYFQNPKFMADVHDFVRTKFKSSLIASNRIESNLKKGDTLQLEDEIEMQANADIDPYGNVNYADIESTSSTYKVDRADDLAFRVYDLDRVRSEHELAASVKNRGLFNLMKVVEEYRFDTFFDRSNGSLVGEVDLRDSAGSGKVRGAAMFEALMDTSLTFDNLSVSDSGNKHGILPPHAIRYLRDAEKLDRATDMSDKEVADGRLRGRTEGFNFADSVHLKKDEVVYTADVKVAGAIDDRKLVLENVAGISKVDVGDYFTESGRTNVVISVDNSTAGEVSVILQYPLKTAVTAGTTLNINGTIAIYAPLAIGNPMSTVMQKNINVEKIREENKYADLYRGFLVHDVFVLPEHQKQIQHVKLLTRDV